jgi:hypothetical protein
VIHFSKGATERYDDPYKKFGVCYLAEDERGAFIEVFGQAKEVILDLSFVHSKSISTIEPSRSLRVVDLTGPGAAWLSAAGEVSAGNHPLSRRWSRALHQHPAKIDGIRYRCRHDQSKKSIAVFDRIPDLLKVVEYHQWNESSMQAKLAKLLDRYKFALKP